ncbi:MAG TPA: hypothetical protein VJ911_03055, partial [Cryomorphaceae bacterium]|nr:hypothetical protein [Cryomorphaceae bacterium]
KVFLFIGLCFMPLLVWQLHVSSIVGEWVGLHPIYHSDSDGLYRPIHQKIWNFHKMTGQTGLEFHRSVNELNQSALGILPAEVAALNVMDRLPPSVYDVIDRDSLRTAYISYRNILAEQYQVANSGGKLLAETHLEEKLGQTFFNFRNQYVNSYPFYSWVVVPLQVYGHISFHSNLSLFVFQKPWRGNPFTEVLRAVCFTLHSLSFLIFPFAAIYFLRRPAITALSLPILIYLGYLVVIQRGVEERYTLPFLIPVLLLCILFLTHIFNRTKLSKFTNRL